MNLDALSDADLKALDAGNLDAVSDAGLKNLDTQTSSPTVGSMARSFNSGLVNGIPNAIDATAALGSSGVEKLANTVSPGTFKDTSFAGNMKNAVMGPALNRLLNTTPYQPQNRAESYANAAGSGLAGSALVPGSAASTVASGIFGGLGAEGGNELGQTQAAKDWLGDYASPALGLAGSVLGGMAGAGGASAAESALSKADTPSIVKTLPNNSRDAAQQLAEPVRQGVAQAKQDAKELFTLAKKGGAVINPDVAEPAFKDAYAANMVEPETGRPLTINADLHPNTVKAQALLTDALSKPLSVDNLQDTFEQLSEYRNRAFMDSSKSDAFRISKLRDAFQQTLKQLPDTGFLSGDAKSVQNLQAANEKYSQLMRLKEPDAVSEIVNGRFPNGEQVMQSLGPATSPDFMDNYSALKKAAEYVGRGDDVKYLSKSAVIKDIMERSQDKEGALQPSKFQQNMKNFINRSPSAMRELFSADEQKVIQNSRLSGSAAKIANSMSSLGGEAALAGIGAHISGPLGAGAGAFAGRQLGKLGQNATKGAIENGVNDILGSYSGDISPRPGILPGVVSKLAPAAAVMGGPTQGQPPVPQAPITPGHIDIPKPPSSTFADKVSMIESGGGQNITSNKSSAFGPHQFIKDTWQKFIDAQHPELARRSDIMNLRAVPALSTEATNWLAQQNAPILAKKGAPVDQTSLYLAHMLNPDKASRLYNAKPNTPASLLVGSVAVRNNPVLKGKSASQVIAWAQQAMGNNMQ